MYILAALFGITLSLAMAIFPAVGIAEKYGAAAGWFCGFTLIFLIAICFELQKIREVLYKEKK